VSSRSKSSDQARSSDGIGHRRTTPQSSRVRSATRTALILFALGSVVAAIWVFTAEGAERVNRATIAAFVLPVFAAVGGAIREVFLQDVVVPEREPSGEAPALSPGDGPLVSPNSPGPQSAPPSPLLHIKTQSAFGRSLEIEAFDAETVLIVARAMGWSMEQKRQHD